LLLALAPTLASAGKSDDALKLLDEGIKLFNSGDLPAARDAFSQAHDLVPDKANPYRWLGLVDARMGRCGDAIKELEIFLQKVPPNDARAAEAVTLRDRCREDVQPRLGTLVVESSPSNAEVRLDDPSAPLAGMTPFRGESVAIGNHVVFVGKSGYEQVARGVAVTQRETAHVQVTLARSSKQVVEVVPRNDGPVVVERGSTGDDGQPPRKKRYWIAGVVVGVLVVAGVGVGLGIGLTQHNPPVFPPVGVVP
jgi:hypothetical protein